MLSMSSMSPYPLNPPCSSTHPNINQTDSNSQPPKTTLPQVPLAFDLLAKVRRRRQFSLHNLKLLSDLSCQVCERDKISNYD